MDITVTQYAVKEVSSERTHKDAIDIQVGAVRTFLTDDVAMELVQKIFKALATPFVEGKEVPSEY